MNTFKANIPKEEKKKYIYKKKSRKNNILEKNIGRCLKENDCSFVKIYFSMY